MTMIKEEKIITTEDLRSFLVLYMSNNALTYEAIAEMAKVSKPTIYNCINSVNKTLKPSTIEKISSQLQSSDLSAKIDLRNAYQKTAEFLGVWRFGNRLSYKDMGRMYGMTLSWAYRIINDKDAVLQKSTVNKALKPFKLKPEELFHLDEFNSRGNQIILVNSDDVIIDSIRASIPMPKKSPSPR